MLRLLDTGADRVVAVVAPQASSLLGLVSVVAPAIVSGSTSVVLASQERPLPAVTLTEVLATSDLPGGVVNLLTGHTAEVAPWLASHMDVNAIDLAGAGPELVADLERAAAENLKRCASADRRGARLARRARSHPAAVPAGDEDGLASRRYVIGRSRAPVRMRR